MITITTHSHTTVDYRLVTDWLPDGCRRRLRSGWFQRGVASLRLDSPAELRSVREEEEDEEEEEQYQVEEEEEEEQQEQESSRPATENPAFSRSLRSITLTKTSGPSDEDDAR